jgi:hypothetical protein
MQLAGKLNGAIENIRLRGFLCQSQCGLAGTIANRQGHIGQLPSATIARYQSSSVCNRAVAISNSSCAGKSASGSVQSAGPMTGSARLRAGQPAHPSFLDKKVFAKSDGSPGQTRAKMS